MWGVPGGVPGMMPGTLLTVSCSLACLVKLLLINNYPKLVNTSVSISSLIVLTPCDIHVHCITKMYKTKCILRF